MLLHTQKYFLIYIHISVHFIIQYAPTHAKNIFWSTYTSQCIASASMPLHTQKIFFDLHTHLSTLRDAVCPYTRKKYCLIYIHISVHCMIQVVFIRMKRGRRKINSEAIFIRFYVKCFTYVYYTTFYKRQSVTLNVTRANSI